MVFEVTTSAYLFQIALEKSCGYLLIILLQLKKIDYLKPRTIHCLLKYEEGIALDLPKPGKASKISGGLRRSPEIVTSLRKSSEVIGSIRVIFGNLLECLNNLRKSSGVFG